MYQGDRHSRGAAAAKAFGSGRNVAVGIAAVAVLGAAACGTSTSDEMVLDLETLEAQTEFGTLEAERAENAYVGWAGEGRVVGLAFADEVGEASAEDEIVVYLYDRQELAMMIGEIDEEGQASLESGELSDFDAAVEFSMEEDLVSGNASVRGGPATPFTADAARGVGGVYWAHGTEEEPAVTGDWVVVPEGEQWGCICPPPRFRGPCCLLVR